MTPAPTPAPIRPRITLVEDDASLLGALTFAFETDRFAVAPYRAARRALEDCRPCDCLVVDLRLPDMDGLTLIDQFRDRGVNAPAILITTNPDERCRTRAANAQVVIVEKPLLGNELRQRVAEALARSRP